MVVGVALEKPIRIWELTLYEDIVYSLRLVSVDNPNKRPVF